MRMLGTSDFLSRLPSHRRPSAQPFANVHLSIAYRSRAAAGQRRETRDAAEASLASAATCRGPAPSVGLAVQRLGRRAPGRRDHP
jgi:hypothetical protein